MAKMFVFDVEEIFLIKNSCLISLHLLYKRQIPLREFHISTDSHGCGTFKYRFLFHTSVLRFTVLHVTKMIVTVRLSYVSVA